MHERRRRRGRRGGSTRSLGRVARNARGFERHALRSEAADERRGMWRRGGGVGALFPEFSAASGGRSPGCVLQIDFQPTPTRASSSAAPPPKVTWGESTPPSSAPGVGL